MSTLLAVPVVRGEPVEAVVQKILPAVVAIEVIGAKAPPRRALTDNELDPVALANPNGNAGGAGTLVSPDGLIATSAAIAELKGEFRVTLHDGRKLAATVVGLDRRSGIGLLRIPGTSFAHVAPQPGVAVPLGARVLAFGRATPSEMEAFPSVTDGIVSAVTSGRDGYAPLIQSTVMTLPTMGGGPLVLAESGAFIGINGFVFTSRTTGTYALTLSVPASEYARVAPELVRNGFVERSVIGLSIAALNDEARRAIGYTRPGGVLVTDVRKDSPAARAGLAAGDIVFAVDQVAVPTPAQYAEAVQKRKPGTKITVGYVRRGQEASVVVETEQAAR